MSLIGITHLVLIAAIVSTLWCRKRLEHFNEQARQNIFSAHLQLRRKQAAYYSQIALLEENSERYFQTLSEAGLPELLKIRTQLVIVNDDITSYLTRGKYYQASQLLQFIENPSIKPHPKLLELTKGNLHILFDWKDRTNSRIISCVIKLGLMSAQNGESPELERLRKNTSASLEQLREVILNERSANLT